MARLLPAVRVWEPPMAKRDVAVKRTESVADQLERVRDQILRRACDLSRASGSPCHHPLQDRLNAEREMVWQPPVELRHKDGRLEILVVVAEADSKDLDVQVTPDALVNTRRTPSLCISAA